MGPKPTVAFARLHLMAYSVSGYHAWLDNIFSVNDLLLKRLSSHTRTSQNYHRDAGAIKSRGIRAGVKQFHILDVGKPVSTELILEREERERWLTMKNGQTRDGGTGPTFRVYTVQICVALRNTAIVHETSHHWRVYGRGDRPSDTRSSTWEVLSLYSLMHLLHALDVFFLFSQKSGRMLTGTARCGSLCNERLGQLS